MPCVHPQRQQKRTFPVDDGRNFGLATQNYVFGAKLDVAESERQQSQLADSAPVPAMPEESIPNEHLVRMRARSAEIVAISLYDDFERSSGVPGTKEETYAKFAF